MNRQSLKMTQIFLFYCFSQILLIGGRNPMEDVEKFKEHGWVVCLSVSQSCGFLLVRVFRSELFSCWCWNGTVLPESVGCDGKLWGLFLVWGTAWEEALMWHQHHLSAVWVKSRAEKCLQWIFHFSLLINFLKLFGAGTDDEVLKESCLPLGFAWRYHVFPVADTCFPHLLIIF